MRASHMMSPACAAVLMSVVAAGAQEVRVPSATVFGPRVYAPPPITSFALSLSDAVRLTVLHSPTIVTRTQTLEQAAGRFQELRGAFDGSLIVSPRFEYTIQPLLPSSFAVPTETSASVAQLANAFVPLANGFRAQAASLTPHAPACPLVYGHLTSSALMAELTIPSLCAIQAEARQAGLIAARSTAVRPVSTITGSGGEGVAGILDRASQAPRGLFTNSAQSNDSIRAGALLAGLRLGGVPEASQRRMVRMDLAYSKPFRSGLQFGASLQFQATEDTYTDTPRDPSLGGNPAPNRFSTTLPASITLPLGKGRGAVAVAAPERAARFGVDAQREQLRHAATEEVYRTVLAYLTLAATQDTVRLLEESASRQTAIVDMTRQRVDAGELPLMERNRAQARAAAVRASLLGARSDLATSRVGLAQSIGADGVSIAGMPTAADRLVVVPASVGRVADLVGIAHGGRHDSVALNQLRLASAALDAGARSDLKRQVDVSVSGGIKNTYASAPYPAPVPVFNPRGYWRSITGRVDPFVQVSLTVELPFGNNTARGRAAQTQADVRSREIDIADLTRSIRENIIGVTGAVGLTLAALERAEGAVKADDEMLAGTLDLFKAGEVTLLDALTTEEQVTSDKIEVVRLRRSYVSALARLRFETGELVRFVTDGTGSDAIAFDPAGFIGK